VILSRLGNLAAVLIRGVLVAGGPQHLLRKKDAGLAFFGFWEYK
jgi:hypothetical protein